MNKIITDGIFMALYFDVIALIVLFYNKRLVFSCYPKEITESAKFPPTENETKKYFMWILFLELIPLMIFSIVRSRYMGIDSFKIAFISSYIKWFIVNMGDLFVLDFLGITLFKKRMIVEGTKKEQYNLKDWMLKYALPEHLLEWPLIMIPVLSLIESLFITV